MSLLRSILFDNLGLKLIALLMALLVYLNAYTERPASMVVSFPVEIEGLPDSLALYGPRPEPVQAELRGTGKQLIRIRLNEPKLQVSVAGVGPGRVERSISEPDLPIGASAGLSVERLIGPRMVQLQIDHRSERRIPLAARVSGMPAAGTQWTGEVILEPAILKVTGPNRALADLAGRARPNVRIDGRRDTVRAVATPQTLPPWCKADPPTAHVRVPIVHAVPTVHTAP